jgi:hypothetical protein
MKEKKRKEKDLKILSKKERKIYDSVINRFPATSHEYAFDVAIQGGVKFDFIPK